MPLILFNTLNFVVPKNNVIFVVEKTIPGQTEALTVALEEPKKLYFVNIL
jgi:hypothetical protein